MTKVKFFEENLQRHLERKVNEFIQDKTVVSISYSTNTLGYNVYHYCCVVYQDL